MADKVATWSINLAGNVGQVSRADADALEALRARVEESKAAVKGLGEAYRSLRGASDEVIAAKAQLKAQLDAERGALSQANLALLKQGQTYEQLTAKMRAAEAAQRKLDAKHQRELSTQLLEAQKKLAEQTKRFGEDEKRLAEQAGRVQAAIRAAGGPIAELSGRFGALREIVGGTGGGLAALTLGVGVVTAAVSGLAAGVVDAAFKLGKFIITSADSLRSMNLMREAASGSAENARNLGTQVDRIAAKVPLAKAAINDLASDMTRAMSGGLSRANGATIVASIEAVATATAAVGPQVGNTFRGLIERGKNFGKFWLSPQDMQGTQVQFTEVAGALAARLHVSLEKAKDVLFRGRLDMATGIGAFKDAINKRFGEVNAAKMLSLDVQLERLGDRFQALSKGVVLEPMLKGLDRLFSKLDPSTKTGKALQDAFLKIGDAIGDISPDVLDALGKGLTMAADAIKGVDLGAALRGVFDVVTNPILLSAAKGLGYTLAAIGAVIGTIGLGAGLILYGLGAAIKGLAEGILWLKDRFAEGLAFIRDLGWSGLGKAIIGGLLGEIEGAQAAVWRAVTGLGSTIKKAFEHALGIGSPSKVFAEYGKQTAAGYKIGVDRAAPSARAASDALVPDAPGGGGGARAALGGPALVLHLGGIHVVVQGAATAEGAHEVAKAFAAPSILRELTRAIREGLVTQGVPTGAGVTP